MQQVFYPIATRQLQVSSLWVHSALFLGRAARGAQVASAFRDGHMAPLIAPVGGSSCAVSDLTYA